MAQVLSPLGARRAKTVSSSRPTDPTLAKCRLWETRLRGPTYYLVLHTTAGSSCLLANSAWRQEPRRGQGSATWRPKAQKAQTPGEQ